jgi:peptide/nickel transport system substrate-binding protein
MAPKQGQDVTMDDPAGRPTRPAATRRTARAAVGAQSAEGRSVRSVGHRRRRGTVGAAALVALGMLAPACGGQTAETGAAPPSSQYANETATTQDPTPGGRLVYGIPAETSSFNPLLATWASYSLTIAKSIYDGLATYDETGTPRPDLAESIEHNADHTVWTIKLRPGVTFSNGKPLNAASVVAMQRAIKASPVLSDVFARVADWEIKNDLTFDVKMNRPWTSFLVAMASQVGVVADPDWLNSADVTHPIGTGPFVVDNWDVNHEMVLRKNPTYWRKDKKGVAYPYLDGITYKVMVDETDRTRALQSGTIDMMMQNYATPSVAALITEARTGKYQAFDDKQFEGPEDYILTNTTKAPLNDVDARRALATALDLDDYVKTVTGGLDTPADGPWKPGSPWYTPSKYPKYDPVEAKRLVEAVKARNGGTFTLKLLGNPSAESTRVQQWLQDKWAKVGIEVTIETTAQQSKIIRMLQGDYELALTQQFDNPNPASEVVYWADNHKAPGALNINFSRISDPVVSELADRAWSTTGDVEKQVYADMGKRLGEVVPYVWLSHASRTVIAHPEVVNVVRATLPDGTPMLQFTQGAHRVHQIWVKR